MRAIARKVGSNGRNKKHARFILNSINIKQRIAGIAFHVREIFQLAQISDIHFDKNKAYWRGPRFHSTTKLPCVFFFFKFARRITAAKCFKLSPYTQWETLEAASSLIKRLFARFAHILYWQSSICVHGTEYAHCEIPRTFALIIDSKCRIFFICQRQTKNPIDN